MDPQAFVQALGGARASAILRTDIADAVRPAMEAAIRGGFGIVEITLTVPAALEHVAWLAARKGLTVGAGTVLTVQDARAAVEHGASFLVSPVVDEAVIEEARRLGVAAVPGCSTPTELLEAHRAGAPLQKVFPAPAGGPAWVKAVLGPMPFLRLVPTHGVTEENAAAWLAAGAHAVGFVASLFDPGDLAAGRFDLIEARARRLLSSIQG